MWGGQSPSSSFSDVRGEAGGVLGAAEAAGGAAGGAGGHAGARGPGVRVWLWLSQPMVPFWGR